MLPAADPVGPPLRILYSFPYRLGVPGIGTTAAEQVRGLIERGHEVHVVTGSAEPGTVDGAASVLETMVLGSRRVPHRALGVDRAMRWHDRRAAAALGHRAVDLVHGWPAAALSTFAAARAAGVPSLREVPNTHTENAYAVAGREAERLGVRMPPGQSHVHRAGRLHRELQEYATADYLLAPSAAVAQTFLARGFRADRLLRHRYGYDPGRFQPAPTRPDGPYTFLFVGRGEPRKGLHLLLDAFLRLRPAGPQARLLVHGELVPSYRAALAHRLRAPGVEELGHGGGPGAVAAAMARADALVLPSLEEGSALVTYEAAGSGLVRVVSDATGAVVRDGVDALVHPAGDTDRLAGHLQALVDDAELHRRLREATLLARTDLTWTAAAGVLEAAYRRALS